jgi:hypothetical protein
MAARTHGWENDAGEEVIRKLIVFALAHHGLTNIESPVAKRCHPWAFLLYRQPTANLILSLQIIDANSN